LRVSTRQLNILRKLNDGSKRAVDFPYDARHILKKMVKREFLIRTVQGVDAEELRHMREEDLKNTEISENLGISTITMQY